MPKPESWLKVTPKGLYCVPGDFFIDPHSGVDRAIVTHGHGDHARPGHRSTLATAETLAISALRMGERAWKQTQAIAYKERIRLGDVEVELFPAGHVLGSAQVAMEYKGSRIVVSGDYKRRPDPTCAPFEVVPCDVFITEATFALPVFRHPDDRGEIAKLLTSVARNPDRTHLVGVYALGKAQRVMSLLRTAGYDQPIYIHGALAGLSELYHAFGNDLGELRNVTPDNKQDLSGAIVLAPPGAASSLRLFPRSHPGRQKSQIRWEQGYAAAAATVSAQGGGNRSGLLSRSVYCASKGVEGVEEVLLE
ncbi:MAG: ligase-associated DNA damage response exonuclease, partial [Pseudomonadota bacterium]|nr:ligase-associated DNA damage response exonuclease [Pseudomonadota bacterium]